MIKKEHLVSDISKLKKVYNQSFPWLVTLAEESENAKYFKDALRSLILSWLTEKERAHPINQGENSLIL